MNRKTKKRAVTIAVIILLLAIAAAGTTAYFTTEARARNVITTGKVDITLNSRNDSTQNIPVMPGVTVQQEVAVSNAAGAADAYVRVKADISLTKHGESEPIGAEEKERIMAVSGGNDDWILHDGWWYYQEILDATPADAEEDELSTTSSLELNITFSGPNMGNEYQNATGTIGVYAQAVQVKNNVPASGKVIDVVGWPEEG